MATICLYPLTFDRLLHTNFNIFFHLTLKPQELATLFRSLPDLQTSSYGYDTDANDDSKVWLKIRQRGTLTGPLSYKGDVFLPNNKVVEFPVEMWSLSFNAAGKVSRVTKGYVIDRTVGNTAGLGGPKGVLVVLGEG